MAFSIYVLFVHVAEVLQYFFFVCVIKSLVEPYTRSLSTAKLYCTASPFDRRVTSIKWHPTSPTLVAASSHGGDIILWDFDNPNKNEFFIQGVSCGVFNISAYVS